MKNLEDGIKSILLDIGKDIKIHKLDNESYVIDMDYDVYTIQIMELVLKYFKDNK